VSPPFKNSRNPTAEKQLGNMLSGLVRSLQMNREPSVVSERHDRQMDRPMSTDNLSAEAEQSAPCLARGSLRRKLKRAAGFRLCGSSPLTFLPDEHGRRLPLDLVSLLDRAVRAKGPAQATESGSTGNIPWQVGQQCKRSLQDSAFIIRFDTRQNIRFRLSGFQFCRLYLTNFFESESEAVFLMTASLLQHWNPDDGRCP